MDILANHCIFNATREKDDKVERNVVRSQSEKAQSLTKVGIRKTRF